MSLARLDKIFLSLERGRVLLVSETENFPFTEMLHFYYCLVLLHLFALEYFSAGTVNEYEKDCIFLLIQLVYFIKCSNQL